MRIQGVDFPEPLLNALRDGRLVVFAGAGVSMGPPAGLPSFRKLAERVAEGISESITESEAVDQFLGRLEGYKGKETTSWPLNCYTPAIQHLVQCTETCFISSIQLVQTYGWIVAFRALSSPTSLGTGRTTARKWNPHLGLVGSAVTISTIAT